MGNNIMLNILRPAVLRQYYGVNKCLLRSDIVSRCTYGFGSKGNNVSTDSNKLVTKLCGANMHDIAYYLKKLLCTNSKMLELDNTGDENSLYIWHIRLK